MGKGHARRGSLGVAALCATAALLLALVVDRAAPDAEGEVASVSGADVRAAPKAKRKPGARGKPKPGAKGKPKPGAGKKKRPGGRPRKPKRPPRTFFGTESFEPLSQGEARAVQAVGIGSYRLVLAWQHIERQPGVRDWSHYDRVIATAAQHRLEVLPVLLGVPPYLPRHPPVGSQAAMTAWSTFAAEAARRYGRGGTFWRLYPGLPYLPVRHWQIWNEQSSYAYWTGPPDATRYEALVRSAAIGIRAVDRRAKILLGGILFHRRDPTGLPMKRFLGQIYSIPGSRRYFDGVAIHPYTIHPFKVIEIAEKARKVMIREGDPKASLWITELGWATGGSSGYVVTPDAQARKLQRTYRLLIQRRAQLRIRAVFWFIFRDARGYPDVTYLHNGLFTVDKQPKPAWSALARVTGGRAIGISDPPASPPPPPRPAPPPPPPSGGGNPCFLLIFC